MPLATFIIEGLYHGTSPAPRNIMGELEESRVYLCPVCGTVWAIVSVPGTRFWAEHISCRDHRHHAQEVPGSIWLPWDAPFNDALPIRVLEREFELAAEQFDTAELTPTN